MRPVRTGPGQAFAFIRSFAILGASGEIGPKLPEGDRQVPEGVYRIVYLNPNSIAHLSLALSYPNPFDRIHAEDRTGGVRGSVRARTLMAADAQP